ncbi:MAG: hypothetical protein NT015_12855 [Alphaproteobacteria bacterium]|nr:hypothetical protein [Alphaproteobacteria bacterium]
MRKSVLKDPIEIVNRLDEIGLTLDECLEIVGAMVAARNSCTENDPASAPGWMAWKEGSRRLREVSLPKGDFQRDNTGQIPSVIDVARGIKIAVCNTDDGTCVEERVPQNRTKKGPVTDRIAAENEQYLFPEAEIPKVSPLFKAKSAPSVITTYYLCVFHEGDDIRAELSCPVEVDAGFFSDFVERIFLITPDGGDGDVPVRRDVPDEGDDGGEFDIPVSRKS